MFKKLFYEILLKFKNQSESHDVNLELQSKDDLIQLQNKYLKELLFHSYNNVPYYNKILKKYDIVNNTTVDLSRFEKIPILTKKILREEYNNLKSKDFEKRNWYQNSSSGSTGEPTNFIQDDIYAKWSGRTFNYYFKKFLKVDIFFVKKIVLWGSERDLFEGNLGIRTNISNWMNNIKFLNSFKMTEEDMNKYRKIINSYKPVLIRGYAGSLFELSKFIEKNNYKIYSPKILVAQAETVTNDMRKKIEDVFRTKLYNFYGSRDVSCLAGECNEGLMHIFSFYNHVEILDDNNQPVKEGKEGRVIVTTLHNYSMPLIRYEIGDLAVLGPQKCTCGNVLPTLKKVSGRIMEQFTRRDGTKVPSEFFILIIGVVCNHGSIKKFQVIQEDYDLIKILVVLKGRLSSGEKSEIEQKIQKMMGNDCRIIWEFVEDIKPTKSGKYLYTKSLIRI